MISDSDKINLINQSLAMVGVSAITALTDTTDKARYGNLWIEDMIYELAEEHDWRFITVASTELSRYDDGGDPATEITPNMQYEYAYALPSNVFTVKELWEKDPDDTSDPGQKSKYEWEVRLSPDRASFILCTDLDDDVYIKYVYNQGSTKTLFSYLFWKVIKLQMAAKYAWALHRDRHMAGMFQDELAVVMSKAIINDLHWSHSEDDDDRDETSWQSEGR